jgi:CBS domain containing-hemolysin-like protein
MMFLGFVLVCAAIYIGTVQAALTKLLRLSFRLLIEQQDRKDDIALHITDPSALFVTARLLMAMVLMLGVLLSSSLVSLSGYGVVITGVMVLGCVLVFQCLVPALIISRDPERVLRILLPSFEVAMLFLQPFTKILFNVAHGYDKSAELKGGIKGGSEGVKSTSLDGSSGDLGETDERRLLRSVFDFGETLVREVMTPRTDIVAIQIDSTLKDLYALFREQEYSRVPVFNESLDDIIGMVFVKDLIHQSDLSGDERLSDLLIRAPYRVPADKRAADLLKEFQARQVQSAIVVDDYGGTAGIVTLEDLLEELVGEIRDEYDVEPDQIIDLKDGSFILAGKSNIDEAAERLGVRIERQGFETIGGYLLNHLGRIPNTGEGFRINDLWIEVLGVEQRRVTRVRIRPNASMNGKEIR